MDDKVKMAISSVSKVVNILAAKKLALFVGITLVFVRGIQYFDSGKFCICFILLDKCYNKLSYVDYFCIIADLHYIFSSNYRLG